MLFGLAAELAAGAISAVTSILIKPLEEIIGIFTAQHKCAHLMKVEGLSVLSKHKIERCESSVFDDYGYKWKMVFSARGTRNPNNISLYVEMEDAASLLSNCSITVDLRFFIVSQSGAPYLPREWYNVSFNSSNTMRGIESWMPHDQLSRTGFLVNDSLIVGFEVMNLRQWNPRVVPRALGTVECLRLVERPQNGKFTWKITKFSSFNQQTHSSNPIIVGQRKWTIQIYPKGIFDGNGNSLSVFLTVSDYVENAPPRAKTLAKFNLRLLNQLNGPHLEYPLVYSFGASGGFGQSQFISLKDLYNKSKGYLVNDVIYIGVDFQVISLTQTFN